MAEIISKPELIGTKYMKPEINQYLVSRQRLHQNLNNSLMCKLTMVIAPAGYGKTTVVLDWLQNCDLPSAWLSVDVYDNNPVLFWQYVCAALDSIADGISKDTDYVFSSRELINANIHISILIDRLSEIESDFLLVLDDLHLISEPSILNGISYLITYLPVKMHLIFISRTEPEIDIARYKIKWQVQVLNEKDLRFQEEEVYKFYQARGFTLEDKEIKKVEDCTEGWAASLVAIAMSMEATAGTIADSIQHSRQDIEQYLRDEVFSAWRPQKREFAVKTIILDTLSGPLCDAVTGNDNGCRMLKEISEQSGFLIAMNNQQNEYRYHSVFKDILNKLLLESYTDITSDLHIKAAEWYRKQGFHAKAINHYLMGCSYEKAITLIGNCTDDYVNRNDYITLLSWIDRLPEEYKAHNFKIALAYVGYYTNTNQLDLAWTWISRMEESADKDKHASDPDFQGYTRTLCGLSKVKLLLLEGKIDGVPLLVKKISELNEDKYFISSGYVDFNAADIYFYRCPVSKIVEMYSISPQEYSDFISNYRRMITKNPGYAPLAIGEYFYESNQLEEALPYLLEALEEARTAECLGTLVPVVVDIARIKRARGDMPGAFEVLQECEKQLQLSSKAHWIYLIRAFRCRLYMDIGDMSKAEEWLSVCRLNNFTEISAINEFELLVYARVMMAKDALNDAELILQRIRIFCENTERLHSKVEVLNLLAMLEYKRGNMSYAVNHIEASLAIGLKEGYIRSYVDEYELMVGLLKQYGKHYRKQKDQKGTEALATYARSLLKKTQESLPIISAAYDETAAAGIRNLLTEQEKKVLEMLLEAYSNQEISDKLNIGLRTVKTYTGNIYSKLGVKNRAQCVKLVREMSFFE